MNIPFKKKLTPIPIILLAISLGACNRDNDNPSPPTDLGIGEVLGDVSESAGQNTQTEPNSTLGSSHLDIDGKWQKDCDFNKSLDTHIIATLEFSGDRFSLEAKEYSDNSCSQLTRQETYPGSIAFKAVVITPSGITAHEIDLDFESAGVWRSLIARQGHTLSMKTASGGANRPSDLNEAKIYNLIN
jgi:hypothetical protein